MIEPIGQKGGKMKFKTFVVLCVVSVGMSICGARLLAVEKHGVKILVRTTEAIPAKTYLILWLDGQCLELTEAQALELRRQLLEWKPKEVEYDPELFKHP